MDMGKLKEIIKNEIEDRLDHKNLNLDIDYFKKVIPSAENISVFIYNILRSKIDKNLSISVTLYETPRNFVVYSG
jgi:6-pyruvoyltetrahydropterin/6-carboxytetrahydropterin synthase